MDEIAESELRMIAVRRREECECACERQTTAPAMESEIRAIDSLVDAVRRTTSEREWRRVLDYGAK